MPSNGTEGDGFMGKFCYKCYKESNCTILTKALCGEQPKQWIYNPEPTCTSFNPDRPKAKKKQLKGMKSLF
jgi:hypothetical protein